MNELIQITTDAQGASVVSARELYSYLGIKKQFADWIKNRIEKYGLIENQDYSTYSLIGEKGRPSVEYALTIDAAKELAMVEGNDKGKQARQYFIECEKALRRIAEQPTPVLSTEQMLVQVVSQQSQLLANHQSQIEQLRADVEFIKSTGHRPAQPRPGRQLVVPGIPAPRLAGLRQQISGQISDYCATVGVTTHETWIYLYKRMYDAYGVNTHRLLRGPGESILDALERYGHLERLYSLVKNELRYQHE